MYSFTINKNVHIIVFFYFCISLIVRQQAQSQQAESLLSISESDTNLDLSALDLGVEPVVRGEGDRQEGSGDYTGYGGKGQRHCGARHLDILSSVSSLSLSYSLLRRRVPSVSLSLFFSRLFR